MKSRAVNWSRSGGSRTPGPCPTYIYISIEIWHHLLDLALSNLFSLVSNGDLSLFSNLSPISNYGSSGVLQSLIQESSYVSPCSTLLVSLCYSAAVASVWLTHVVHYISLFTRESHLESSICRMSRWSHSFVTFACPPRRIYPIFTLLISGLLPLVFP